MVGRDSDAGFVGIQEYDRVLVSPCRQRTFFEKMKVPRNDSEQTCIKEKRFDGKNQGA